MNRKFAWLFFLLAALVLQIAALPKAKLSFDLVQSHLLQVDLTQASAERLVEIAHGHNESRHHQAHRDASSDDHEGLSVKVSHQHGPAQAEHEHEIVDLGLAMLGLDHFQPVLDSVIHCPPPKLVELPQEALSSWRTNAFLASIFRPPIA